MDELRAGDVVTVGAGHPCAGEREKVIGPGRDGTWICRLVSDGEEVWLLPRYIAVIRNGEPVGGQEKTTISPGLSASLFERERIV